jgi:NADH-quinone oxidoreductase subunit J
MTPSTLNILYLVFTIGGAGLYFVMPKSRQFHPAIGALLGLFAIAALFGVWAARVVSDSPGVYFYLFAAVAVIGSARVITHPRPLYSALYFVLVVLAVSGILVLQYAEFLAVALVMIYAGAILVTYLFVIMMAHQGGAPIYDRRAREPLLSVLAGFVVMATVATRAGETSFATTHPIAAATAQALPSENTDASAGNTFAVGSMLMTRYVIVLELSGLLLLISMIGAIALSRKKVPADVIPEPSSPLGKVGREAVPF